tara:strand:- start:91639 stop:93585 length:1947 start_codon:yes stop_codon:yes gene_type:complete
MFTSFEEFKFFQSFRIPVEANDDVRCMIEYENEFGKFEFIKDAKLEDVSVTGIGFITGARLSVGTNIRMSINFKRLRIDIEGHVVRSFGYEIEEDIMLYGIEIDSEDQQNMRRFLEQYTSSFSPDRARECLTNLALSERYKKATESIEVFSLMLSLFKDITSFGSQETFLKSMLEEITRILNSQRASIFLINPQTNELEAVSALGIDKEILKFDYRKGIAGSVFTTGVALNIDCKTDKVRFNDHFDEKTGFETKSILCHPITNREDKVIGVIEVLNKRNEDRFTMEDEKTMKVLSLIFSSVFHNYNPISEKSMIRRFSTPYDREHAYIGRSPQTNEMRRAILKLKDLDTCLTIQGETGTGKRLMAQIIHNEGKRGLNNFEILNCKGVDHQELWKKIVGTGNEDSVLEQNIGGTIVFHEIASLPLKYQEKLFHILKNRRIEGSKISLDSRVIFTSSVDLTKLANEEGEFNLELLDYLSTSVLNVVPLRKRAQDIDDLLSYFLRKECRKQGLLLKEFSDEIKEELRAYDWPGNISELQKAVEKAVLYNPKAHVITKLKTGGATPIVDMSKASIKGLDNIPFARDYNIPLKDRVALVEREMILAEIKRNGGNKSKAAKEMGISREALRKKLLISDTVLEDIQKDKDEKSAA